ncbi:MAG: prolipoprotein diacylglyceryl transferase [Candidatus Riflebacteria bacterium]|nr:prolipoprotein diacylglyceryl transferase [Candidatus Riflebacteria bacterium]
MKSLLGIDLPFYSYGILMGFSFLFGVWLFKYNSRKCKIARPPLLDLFLIISIFGVIGARINYILLFPQYYHSFRDYIALHEGGLVYYGGMIAAIIALFIYCKIKKYSFAMTADYMVPSLALGHAFGRIGCLINDCCYGVQTNFIKIYQLKSDPEEVYRHPTQLYEIIYLFILATVFSLVIKSGWQEKNGKRGFLASFYVISYSILRFLNEYLRADARGGFYTALKLSPAQVTSIILGICGILYIIIKSISNKKTVDCGEKANE